MKTILQIEDDPNDIFFLCRALAKYGASNSLRAVCNAERAIAYLEGTGKFHDRKKFPLPSLVLLDLKLSATTGLELLEWIRRKLGPGLPVVILSDSTEKSDISSAYRLGANAFLTKPAKTGQLADTVKAVTDFWLGQNTPLQQAAPESGPESPKEGVASLIRSSADQDCGDPWKDEPLLSIAESQTTCCVSS